MPDSADGEQVLQARELQRVMRPMPRQKVQDGVSSIPLAPVHHVLPLQQLDDLPEYLSEVPVARILDLPVPAAVQRSVVPGRVWNLQGYPRRVSAPADTRSDQPRL